MYSDIASTISTRLYRKLMREQQELFAASFVIECTCSAPWTWQKQATLSAKSRNVKLDKRDLQKFTSQFFNMGSGHCRKTSLLPPIH